MLRADGFLLVTMYEEFGEAETRVADHAMIRDCGLKNRVLLTADQDLVYTWAKEIAEAKIAVFVTTNNNEGPTQWGPRIIGAKSLIMRELQRRKRPFTAKVSSDARVTQVRLYEAGRWKTIPIGRKNPPHSNKYKPKAGPEPASRTQHD